MQIDRVTTAPQKPKDCWCLKYKSTILLLHHINHKLLVSQIQVNSITTTPQKPKGYWCPEYKSTMLPLHHMNQNMAGVPDTSQQR